MSFNSNKHILAGKFKKKKIKNKMKYTIKYIK